MPGNAQRQLRRFSIDGVDAIPLTLRQTINATKTVSVICNFQRDKTEFDVYLFFSPFRVLFFSQLTHFEEITKCAKNKNASNFSLSSDLLFTHILWSFCRMFFFHSEVFGSLRSLSNTSGANNDLKIGEREIFKRFQIGIFRGGGCRKIMESNKLKSMKKIKQNRLHEICKNFGSTYEKNMARFSWSCWPTWQL